MPSQIGEFSAFCNDHYKIHASKFPKHIMTKQSYIGTFWNQSQSENPESKSKCSLCKHDLIKNGGVWFYVYKAGIVDKSESLILCKNDFLKFK